ncbi:60S ribosomal protein L13a, partial [Pseudoloma neurophilia]
PNQFLSIFFTPSEMIYEPNRIFEYNQDTSNIIINAQDHVAGKLATFVAKNILEGQKVTVVNAEYLVLTGPIKRSIGKFNDYLNKRRLINPSIGHKHHRSPSMFLQRIIRRMVPKKIIKGQKALKLLTIYESCPDELAHKKWMVCPRAQLKNTSDPIRKSFYIKELLTKFGWKYSEEADLQYQRVMAMRNDHKAALEVTKQKEDQLRKSDRFEQRVKELMEQIE